MKKLFILPFLLATLQAASFTELYVQSGGSNLNAGSDSTNSASITYASGNWVAGTGVFTVASGDPASAGVASGQWASVYPDGSSETVFVGRVTASSSTTITVSLAAKSGTAPTDGTGNRTLKIGGAWAGPNGTVDFPFNFVQNTHTNSSGNVPWVNIKGGTAYSVTDGITHANAGPLGWSGYTTTVRDGGKANIDGGSSGASYVLMTISGNNQIYQDLDFSDNGATGTSTLINFSGAECVLRRLVIRSARGSGINLSGTQCAMVECEAYGNNESNTANGAGYILSGADTTVIRSIAHDNTGSAVNGFRIDASVTFINCIADSNGNEGFFVNNTVGVKMIGCDSYGNGGDGADFTGASAVGFYVENCNFTKNTGWGINSSGSAVRNGYLINNGFGAGTEANGSGTINGLSGVQSGVIESGNITYASNASPWVDAPNGDFRITLAASKGAGRGSFTQTASSYAGAIGYPDVGAAQHLESPSAGGEKSFLFVK